MTRQNWAEDVRIHLALASVGGSTLMKQSGKGRSKRAQSFLLNEMKLTDLPTTGEADFQAFLTQKTIALAKELPRPSDNQPNWGAARKVLNIYLRLCAMNKDLHPHFLLSKIEPFLEVPLDGETVKGMDQHARTNHSKTFKIIDLTAEKNSELQSLANEIAIKKGLHRYELDVLFWNRQ